MINNNEFKRKFDKILGRVESDIKKVVINTSIELHKSMVHLSPVLTGLFKSNWQAAVGSAPNLGTISRIDKSGGLSIQRASATIRKWDFGKDVFMTNSLPYAKKLERGFSRKAPRGMVILTAQNFKRLLRIEVRKLR